MWQAQITTCAALLLTISGQQCSWSWTNSSLKWCSWRNAYWMVSWWIPVICMRCVTTETIHPIGSIALLCCLWCWCMLWDLCCKSSNCKWLRGLFILHAVEDLKLAKLVHSTRSGIMLRLTYCKSSKSRTTSCNHNCWNVGRNNHMLSIDKLLWIANEK